MKTIFFLPYFFALSLFAQNLDLWQKTLGKPGSLISSFIRTSDGGAIASGSTGTLPNGRGSDIWVFKVSRKGDTVWERIIDWGGTKLGGHIATSGLFQNSAGQYKAWLFSFDIHGNSIAQ